MSTAASAPHLRIVKGNPTDEEIAALVAVLQAAAATAPARQPTRHPTSEWSAPHRRLCSPPRYGPGAWRASSLPR